MNYAPARVNEPCAARFTRAGVGFTRSGTRDAVTACGRLPRAGTRFTRAGARFTRAGARLPRAVTASSRSLRGCRGRRLVSKSRMVSFLYHIISSLQTRRTTRRERVLARLFQDHGAGLSPCLRRHASFEATSRDTRNSQHAGHALPEGTARATQLTPSAVTASAVGGSANRSVRLAERVRSPTTDGCRRASDVRLQGTIGACSSQCFIQVHAEPHPYLSDSPACSELSLALFI